jgi:Raf kinase inhibitor-like YbhB/YbcL family protein
LCAASARAQDLPPPVSEPPVNAPVLSAPQPQTLTLTSTSAIDSAPGPKSFEGGQNDCTGGNLSPALAWSGEPAATGSFAVTMFDPDAKPDGYLHWAVINIPAATHSLAAGAGNPEINALPPGAQHLANSAGVAGYSGACPPRGSGVHHYEIVLYALGDANVTVPAGLAGKNLTSFLYDKAIATSHITPTYERD